MRFGKRERGGKLWGEEKDPTRRILAQAEGNTGWNDPMSESQDWATASRGVPVYACVDMCV